MFVCFILQIFFRYVLNNPLGWTEEVIVTMLAVDRAVGRGVHPRREGRDPLRHHLLESCPSAMRRIFTVITGVALIVLYGISLPAS